MFVYLRYHNFIEARAYFPPDRGRLKFPLSSLSALLVAFEEFHKHDANEDSSATIYVDLGASLVTLDYVFLGPENPREFFKRFHSVQEGELISDKTMTLLEWVQANTKKNEKAGSIGASTKRGGFLKQIDQDCIDCLTKFVATGKRQLAEVGGGANAYIYIEYWHGKLSTVPKTATAFYHRRKRFAQVILGTAADDPQQELRLQSWVTDSFHQLNHQADMFGGHSNTPTTGMTDWFRFYWKSNYDRLRKIKSDYDPDELFRHPHSVRPLPPSLPPTNPEDEEEAPPSRFQISNL